MLNGFEGLESLKLPEAEIAYCAGIFDGEGSISIIKAPSSSYCLRVQMSLVKGVDVLRALQAHFGGNTRSVKPAHKDWSLYYMWYCNGPKAADCLRTLLPFLRIKAEEAKLALEFYNKCSSLTPSRGRGHKAPSIAVAIGAEYKERLGYLQGRKGKCGGRHPVRLGEDLSHLLLR